MKPIGVTDDSYVEYNENPMELYSHKKDPKFKVGDFIRTLKNKIF